MLPAFTTKPDAEDILEDERSGALGCGCALIPGLLLGVITFVLVGLLAQPASPAVASQSHGDAAPIRVALSEEYLSRLIAASLGGGPLAGLEVDVSPGNVLVVSGQASVSVLGRDMGLPISFRLRATARAGSLQLDLVSSELPGGMEAAQATTMVKPLLARLAGNLQSEMQRALGPGWRVEDIITDDSAVILLLMAPRSEP